MKISFAASFGSQSIKREGLVAITWLIPQSDLAQAIKTVLFKDQPFRLGITLDQNQRLFVGMAGFAGLTIGKSGESRFMVETDMRKLRMTTQEIASLIGQSFTVHMANTEQEDTSP